MPNATVVCTARFRFFVSFAPNSRATITPAPDEMPCMKPMSMNIRLPDELTAASELEPSQLPTISESTVLYSC